MEKLTAEEMQKQARELVPPKQDVEQSTKILHRLSVVRDERNVNRKEYDGMTFEQDYERNRETAFSYLRPKKNDDDVRVNSGTSEKKVELMVNELMSMNFQPEVRAFDENELELRELGKDLTDLVRMTNEQENDEDMWEDIYMDLLTQRAAFIEECETEELPGGFLAYGDREKRRKRGVKRRISPLQVYLGDLCIPLKRLNDQPFIIVYDRMLYSEAKALWEKNPNFKYVQAGTGIHREYISYFKYRFSAIQNDEVEVITYMSSAKHDDEYQVIINGVLMFDEGKKMDKRNGYPIRGATVKTIPDHAYGKPPIASAKFLQAIQDETLRNLIRKMRQAIEPPIAVKAGGKIPNRDMWQPSAITQGLSADMYSRLIDHQGVTSSEFSMLQLITQKAEEFIGSASISNPAGTGKMTATQVIEIQKQAIKMLGLAVMAVMRLKRDMTFDRLDTIMREYFKPLEESAKDGKVSKKYRTFELPNCKDIGGYQVKKYIVLLDRKLSDKELEDVKRAEDEESENGKKPVRYSFLNVDALSSIPLLFRVVVNPESRDSGAFDKILFQDKMSQAANIMKLTGRKMNADKLIEDFETTWKANDMFEDSNGEAAQMMEQLTKMSQGQEMQGSEAASNLSASPEALLEQS